MWESSSLSPSSSLESSVRRSELYRDVVVVSRLLKYEDIAAVVPLNAASPCHRRGRKAYAIPQCVAA